MLLTQAHDEPVYYTYVGGYKKTQSPSATTQRQRNQLQKIANDGLLNFYYIIIIYFFFLYILFGSYIYFFLFFLRGSGEEFLPPSPEKKKVKRWVLIKKHGEEEDVDLLLTVLYLLPSIRLCVCISVLHHLHLPFEFIKDVGKDPGKRNKENIVYLLKNKGTTTTTLYVHIYMRVCCSGQLLL